MSRCPAFPTPEFYDEKLIGGNDGMTLRDYFAAKAMQSLMLDREFLLRGISGDVADRAYEYADAMLKERAK